MSTIELKGRITEARTLDVELPDSLPIGEARVTIEPLSGQEVGATEVAELLRVDPLPGKEIVQAGLTGVWKDQQISSGRAWVDQLRQQRKTRRGW